MNPNLLVTTTFVESLAQAGLTDAVICPGSRSTPLTLAFEAHPSITTHLQLDERSGAFYALGLGLTTDRPAAIVCTSGTAAANFYPAIIEAHMSQVPLLILTADRPPELRHSGANQTIDQVKMFGDQVLWAVDMGLPAADPPPAVLRNVATTGQRAFSTANGRRKGAVHINFPFRKPLEPLAEEWAGQRAAIRADVKPVPPRPVPPILGNPTLMPDRETVSQLAEWINHYEKGVIVCGPRCPGGDFPQALTALAQRAGYPIFADPLSGLRFGPHHQVAEIISSYETTFSPASHTPDWEAPDIVIRFGQVPTSKWLNSWLGKIEPAVRLHVRANGVWADDSHLTTDFWPVDEIALCQLTQSLIARGAFQTGLADQKGWLGSIRTWESRFWEGLEQADQADWDGGFVIDLCRALPEGSHLMIGNSLPIRHIDQFVKTSAKRLKVYSNRGASGIDGVISTACGIAWANPDQPTVLLIGDVSFYHDMNGLLAARQLPNLTIILMNNDSGSIFRRLPIAKHEPPFTRLFLTQHGLNFEHAARLYGLSYTTIESRQAFRAWASDQFSPPSTQIVEIKTDGAADAETRAQLLGEI